MENILITRAGSRQRAYPLTSTPIRVTSHCGAGSLRYLTDDGYCGVALDGDRTFDGRQAVAEIDVRHLSLAA